MMRNSFKKHLQSLLIFLLTISVVLVPNQAGAIYEGVRSDTGIRDGGMCDTGKMSASPFMDNRDLDWVLTNPTCISYMLSSGTAIKAADIGASYFCLTTSQAWTPSTAPLSPWTTIQGAKLTSLCATYLASGNPAASTCCAGAAFYVGTVATAVSVLMTMYAVAEAAYENARICGHDWNKWTKDDDNNWTKSKGNYQLCLLNKFAGTSYDTSNVTCGSDSTANITNQQYREYIFGGREYIDNNCKNPAGWDSDKKKTILGYADHFQRYYMTGPAATPVFACYRFLAADRTDTSAQVAYDCCKKRSQEVVCIENKSNIAGPLGDYQSKFCQIGSKCNVGGVVFEAYASSKQLNYACARTYNVCPYDHLLGGGTEVEEMRADDPTQVKNFCQFLNHCQKLPILPYIRTTDLDGGFISSACYDMKGDSQNVYGYTAQLIPINTRGFSAPMAQCFKDTMENIFLHKAGHSICQNPDEFADANGICASGDYFIRKGFSLPDRSFFTKVQNNLQDIIKIALSMSVMFLGAMTLLGLKAIEKKQLLPYILKLGLVMYFAVGDGWQFGFMTGVLNTSSYLSEMVMKIDESADSDKLDGCQFPRYNYADDNEDTKYDNPAYPNGEEYLRIWDTFDCKIAAALGFGPEVSVPNLIFMILGGFLTGGMGIVFVVATFLFAFFLISIAVRALHIFLISTTAVIILIYISPITITCMLFAKTKGIFDSWWKKLLGFTLNPIILFAYLGILITLFNVVVIGDVTFTGDGKSSPKQISCGGDAKDTSMYCIFRVADIKTLHGLEVLGVGLPTLLNLNQTKLNSIIKAAILMFIFASFMDKISDLAEKLVGGDMGAGWRLSVSTMASKSYGALKSIQDRGMNAVKKHGGKVARAGIGMVKGAGQVVGNKGRAVTSVTKEDGASHTGNKTELKQTENLQSKQKAPTDNKNSGDDHTGSKT